MRNYNGWLWRKWNGYFMRNFYIDGRKVTILQHRYIWEEYYGKIPDNMEVHHIDRNRSNNDISNLTLMSANNHMSYHNIGNDYRKRSVKQYDLNGNYIRTFNKIRDFENGKYSSEIVKCCRGKRKSSGGYKWEYE